MSGRPKVLILDGMWNKSLAAVRSLGSKGFHVTAGEKTNLATALFSRYCSKRFIYPSPGLHPEAFIDALEKELAERDYDVLMPFEWTTQLLITDQANRSRLETFTRIPFVDPDIAKFANDKAQLMKYAKQHGIDVPETYFITTLDELETVSNDLKYPVLIKPRTSSGSRGMSYAINKDELMRKYPVVHQSYPLPIIQEFIPGKEIYGVGALLNFQSRMRASFVYRRIRSYPVAGGPSTVRVSTKRDDLTDITRRLLESLKWTGVAHAEFKIDPRDGRPKLLEINPRFWGSLALAIQAGVDFPYLLYKLAMEGDVAQIKDYETDVICRWLIPGDLLHFIHNPARFRMNPGFFDFRIKDDIISLHDPLPTLGRILSAFTFLSDKEMRALIKR